MKKVLAAFLIITMMMLSLAGCGSETGNLSGTWEVDSVEIDGTSYTVAELEAMGDDSMSQLRVVLKDGGKAFVSDGESGGVVDWTKTETGVKIGEQDGTIDDGRLCLDFGGGKIFMKKISENQTIGDEKTDKAENTTVAEQTTGSERTTAAEQTTIGETTTTKEQSNNSGTGTTATQTSVSSVTIRESPDKYTWYIKNYVGKNCASIGYTSMGGDRMDRYGAGFLELVFIAADGTYIDIDSKDDLKQYVVTGQNIEPNTELRLTFSKDSEGKEYDALVAAQNYEEVVLSVRKVDSSDTNTVTLTAIEPSPDKYTWYIADYRGRNLANCGYLSLGGNLMDRYGDSAVKLVIVSEDGAYIDPEDTEAHKGYVVTAQNIAPNSELRLVFAKNSEGVEYDSLVESQNIEEIELTVKAIGSR